VKLRVVHVFGAELPKGDLRGELEFSPEHLRLFQSKQVLGDFLTGAARRLLDPVSVGIVEVDPVCVSSRINSQLRLPFYPLPAAPRIVRKMRQVVPVASSIANVASVGLNELFEIGQLESQRAPNLHERDSSLPNPTVECRNRNLKESSRFLNGH